MVEEREVQRERAIEFAKEHAIHKVFETSAKTGDQVEEVFSCAGKELFHMHEEPDEKDGNDGDEPTRDSGSAAPKKKAGAGTGGKKLNNMQGGTTKKKGKGGCC